MSYNSKNFSVMAYANGFTLWNYTTADTLAAVKGNGYFDETAPFVRKGDMILVNASAEGTLEPAVLSVSEIVSGAVTIVQIAPAAVA